MEGRLVEHRRRLRITPGQKVAVVNAPSDCAALIPMIGAVDPDDADAVIGFATRRSDLDLLESVYTAARAARLAWLAYTKPGPLGTDLYRDWLRRAILRYDVLSIMHVSLDDTWSALLLDGDAAAYPDEVELAWPAS